MTEPRICAYPPCSEPYVPGHPEQRFCQALCRTRQWKAERAYGAQKTVRTDRRKPSGVQLSYRKAVEAMTEFLLDFEPALAEGPDTVQRSVERALAKALPARQRERLEGKR